ncbi:MAG: hypothetical protein K6T34_04725 [Thermoflavifilum sp.]|nr:hypothetical protein [Thermoflavifilum sp.]
MNETLTPQEEQFLLYWEQVRRRLPRWKYRLGINLMFGLVFGLLMITYFLVDGWRDRALVTHGDLVLITLGALMIAVFVAVVRSVMQWEKNEQRYIVLQLKKRMSERGI